MITVIMMQFIPSIFVTMSASLIHLIITIKEIISLDKIKFKQ